LENETQVQRPPLTKAQKKAVEKHLREVRRQLRRNLFKAYRGWWYWRKLLKKYKKDDIKNTAVILLPEIHDRDNYFALRYLDQMLNQHKFRRALILTHNGAAEKCASLFSDKITAVVHCPRKKAEELMQFYCLYNFDKRFSCASLDEPYGRNGSRVIGARGITAEEIFVIGVYRTYPYERLSAPGYKRPKTPQIILRPAEQEPLTEEDRMIMEFLRQGDIADEEAAKSAAGENT
jgi:hypothetical protein